MDRVIIGDNVTKNLHSETKYVSILSYQQRKVNLRRRRKNCTMEGEVRSDSRRHEGPETSGNEEENEKEGTDSPLDGAVLVRGTILEIERHAAGQIIESGNDSVAVVSAYHFIGFGHCPDSPNDRSPIDERQVGEGRTKTTRRYVDDIASSGLHYIDDERRHRVGFSRYSGNRIRRYTLNWATIWWSVSAIPERS